MAKVLGVLVAALVAWGSAALAEQGRWQELTTNTRTTAVRMDASLRPSILVQSSLRVMPSRRQASSRASHSAGSSRRLVRRPPMITLRLTRVLVPPDARPPTL